FTLTVSVVPPPTVDSFNASPSRTGEGAGTGFSVSGTFSDPNGAAEAPFTAVVHWGDGTTDTVAVSGTANPFGFAFDGNHTYAPSGTYNLTVPVTNKDRAGGTSAAVSVGVANVAPMVAMPTASPTGAGEGTGTAFSVSGTFTDPAGALDQ